MSIVGGYIIIGKEQYGSFDFNSYPDKLLFYHHTSGPTIYREAYHPRVIYMAKDVFDSSAMAQLGGYFESGATAIGIDASRWKSYYPSVEMMTRFFKRMQSLGVIVYIFYLQEIREDLQPLFDQYHEIIIRING